VPSGNPEQQTFTRTGDGANTIRRTTMKRLILTTIMLGASCACAQTTNLTFQWHGQTMGVQFKMTNLTDSVKIAIRDDIAYSLSLIPATNVTFEAMTASTNYSGNVRIHYDTPINYCGGILCFYKTVGGNIYWQIGQEACSKYLAAIALTNQHAAAVNSFSNFYHQVVNGFDVTGMTFEEKKSFFWGSPAMEDFEEEEGANFEQTLTKALSFRPNPPLEEEIFPYPSIRAFIVYEGAGTGLQTPTFVCEMKRWEPSIKSSTWSFIYLNGKWRYCMLCP
jgi:hypothetical protein